MLNKKTSWTLGLLSFLFALQAPAALLTFNSSSQSDVAATRNDWLIAIGIPQASYLIDFESGFSDGENISGNSQIGGLIITDTSGPATATVSSGLFGGSNPVGQFALGHNERAYLEFDFSNAPVDYFGFKDIDHTGTNGLVTFVGGATVNISFETTATSGDSAEFFGLYRNDQPQIALVQLNAAGDGSWAVDDLEFGAPVPLPGALYLLLTGLGGLFVARQRKAI